MRSFIISGIRSKKAKTKSGILQVMSLVDILVYNKQSDSLSRIKEVKSDILYSGIPFDVIRRSLGIFITEVCSKAIKEKEENRSLFQLLRNQYLTLDTTQDSLMFFHHRFLVTLARELGFGMSMEHVDVYSYFNLQDGIFEEHIGDNRYSLDAESTEDLKMLLRSSKEGTKNLHLPKQKRITLLNNLLKYFQYHVDNFGELRSLPVLKQVLQ